MRAPVSDTGERESCRGVLWHYNDHIINTNSPKSVSEQIVSAQIAFRYVPFDRWHNRYVPFDRWRCTCTTAPVAMHLHHQASTGAKHRCEPSYQPWGEIGGGGGGGGGGGRGGGLTRR